MQAHRTYSFTSSAFEGEVILGYNKDGYLVKYECRANMSNAILDVFLGRLFPHLEVVLKELVAKSTQGAAIKLLPPDLSFEHFYQLYDNKVDKKAAERRWNALSNADKVAALNHISIYNSQLARSGAIKMYPSTYLSKARWNDHK